MNTYTENEVKTLEWNEHIRRRPGMYIGKLGDGSSPDDGIYILLKEVLDNSIDEFMMGFGKNIDININDDSLQVRDYGRGIPQGKLLDAASVMNTGAKYDSKVFKKSVGLNGVGIKAVNALSTGFTIKSFREGEVKIVEFSKGHLIKNHELGKAEEQNGVQISFTPDEEIFGNYHFIFEYIESMLKNYAFLNPGLVISLNGQK